MLIESYDLKIEVSTHSTEEFEYEAIAHLSIDISPVLPYLNATLHNGTYLPDAPAFSWREDSHHIGFWPHRIAIDHLESRPEAERWIEKLVKMVNDVWEKRDSIQPDITQRENLQPLELFRLLPKTNCKECGENTCFNFALKLAAGQKELANCSPLHRESTFSEQRGQLECLLFRKRTLL
jgi:ArsR family metal-binding transcriptional regulator